MLCTDWLWVYEAEIIGRGFDGVINVPNENETWFITIRTKVKEGSLQLQPSWLSSHCPFIDILISLE